MGSLAREAAADKITGHSKYDIAPKVDIILKATHDGWQVYHVKSVSWKHNGCKRQSNYDDRFRQYPSV